MFAAAPPWSMIPWIRQSDRTCCRSMLTALNVWIQASRALTPAHGSAEAWAALPAYSKPVRTIPRRSWWRMVRSKPWIIIAQSTRVEHAAPEELHLAAAALLGGRADHLDSARGKPGPHGCQRRARPRARRRDDVVPARVPDARQRVVLAHDRDGGTVAAAVHGRAERGRDTGDAAFDLEPLGLEERGRASRRPGPPCSRAPGDRGSVGTAPRARRRCRRGRAGCRS